MLAVLSNQNMIQERRENNNVPGKNYAHAAGLRAASLVYHSVASCSQHV